MTANATQLSFDELTSQVRADPRALTYTLERSARRRSSVQITVLPNLSVRVVAPVRLSKARIDEMVRARRAWILKRREELHASRALRTERRWLSGERLPLLDESLELRIRPLTGRHRLDAVRQTGVLVVTVPAGMSAIEPIERVVAKWYRMQAHRELCERVAYFAEKLDVQPRAVLVRNQRSRWGSCARDGTLRFCWRLVLAPRRILDYVVVHELSHLRHPHHQRSFWECVRSVLPDCFERRAELKRDGDTYCL